MQPDHLIDSSTEAPSAADRERGASLVEYALLVALIALVAMVAVQFFGGQTSASFNSTATSVALAN